MSNLYGEFIYTNFPDQPFDTYEYMQDLNLDLVDLVSQYESLINSKKFDEASNLLRNNPSLNRIYFNAEKYNKLVDGIRAAQRLYSEDVQTYVLELAKFRGAYSNNVKYTRYNVVEFNSMIYMCMATSTPLGTIPTNTEYWYPLSIKGEKGVGIGLSYDGNWQAEFTYNKDSAVSYGTTLYASKTDNNIGRTPSPTSEYWEIITDFKDLISYNNSSSNLEATDLQSAIDELNTKIINNINNININTNKLNTIESGAQKNALTGVKGSAESNYRTGNVNITPANLGITVVNNTADSNKRVAYATTSGSCSGNSATATSAGNSDTVDGFHFQLSTTDLDAGTSPLTTNTFYFVYE